MSKQISFYVVDNDQTPPELLKWCASKQESALHCDENGTITHPGRRDQHWCIRTSSSISSNVDTFYFECQVFLHKYHYEITSYEQSYYDAKQKKPNVGIAFTTSRLTKKKPSDDPNTLGLQIGSKHDFSGENVFQEIRTVQYGPSTVIENVDQIKDGDIIGMVFKRVVIDEKKHSVFQPYLNGTKLGHPLLSDTLIESAYPTIWMDGPGCSIKTNLGSIPFNYGKILGNFEYLYVKLTIKSAMLGF